MGKRKKLEPSAPSKAYLVSFGDTMTALLAFFIVINSLAKEQTGANLHAGTGSFVNALSNSGVPAGYPGNQSHDMIQQESQKPIYALRENLEKNFDSIGPDDTNQRDKVKNRDHEQFQKFLIKIEKEFGLKDRPAQKNQVAFDSFERFDRDTGALSKHAIELLSESIAKMRRSASSIEIIVWADVPSQTCMRRHLGEAVTLKKEVESKFWLSVADKRRIRYRVKPWLFSDAKRPVLTIVYSEIEPSNQT